MGKTRRKLKAVHKLKAGSKRKARHIRKTTRTQKGGNISMGKLIKAAGQYNFEQYNREKLTKIFDEKYTPEKRHRICDDINNINENIDQYEEGSEAIEKLTYLKDELKNYSSDFKEKPKCLFPEVHPRNPIFKAPIIGQLRYIGPDNSNKCLVNKENNITLNKGEILNVHKKMTNDVDIVVVSKQNNPQQFRINMGDDCYNSFKIIEESEPVYENIFPSESDENAIYQNVSPPESGVVYATMNNSEESEAPTKELNYAELNFGEEEEEEEPKEPIYAIPNNIKIKNIEAGSIIEFTSMPTKGCWAGAFPNESTKYKNYNNNPFIPPKLKVVANQTKTNDSLIVTNPDALYVSENDNNTKQFSIDKKCLKGQLFKVIPPPTGGKKTRRRKHKKTMRKRRTKRSRTKKRK